MKIIGIKKAPTPIPDAVEEKPAAPQPKAKKKKPKKAADPQPKAPKAVEIAQHKDKVAEIAPSADIAEVKPPKIVPKPTIKAKDKTAEIAPPPQTKTPIELTQKQTARLDESQGIWQAIGFLEGTINSKRDTMSVKNSSGELITFPVFVPREKRKEVEPDTTQKFALYPQTSAGGLRFRVAGAYRNPALEPGMFAMRGIWKTWKDGQPRLIVYRNPDSLASMNDRFTALELDWQDAPQTDGSFWQLLTIFDGSKFVVDRILGTGDRPPQREYPNASGEKDAKAPPQKIDFDDKIPVE